MVDFRSGHQEINIVAMRKNGQMYIRGVHMYFICFISTILYRAHILIVKDCAFELSK